VALLLFRSRWGGRRFGDAERIEFDYRRDDRSTIIRNFVVLTRQTARSTLQKKGSPSLG